MTLSAYLLLLLALLAGWLLLSLSWRRRRQTPSDADSCDAPLHHPPMRVGGTPTYAILDLQTNGLIDSDSAEVPEVVELSWLVTDSALKGISRGTLIIQGVPLGDDETRRVHKVTSYVQQQWGISVDKAVEQLMYAIAEVPVLVCHHAAFDLTVLSHLLTRTGLDAEKWLASKQAVCTMTLEGKSPYLTLEKSLLRFRPEYADTLKVHRSSFVSWRKVCCTRALLESLLLHYHLTTPPLRVAIDFINASQFS